MRSLPPLLLVSSLVVACGSAVDSSGADAGPNQSGDGGASPDSSMTLDAMPGAPDAAPGPANITNFATCSVPAPGTRPWHINAPSPTPARNLYRKTVDLAAHPEAVCNDGTAAVYYVRAGSGSGANRWQIHLQGGGACRSYQECLDRWCSAGTNYDASKMSSRWAPSSMEGNGIFDRKAANTFANWNHVFVYYCSSDGWKGRASDSVVSDPVSATYTAHFQGHNIVAAVIDELKAGATSDGAEQTVGSIDSATQVLFTGTSAGSGGVRTNADWLDGELRESNPNVQYRAVFDAAMGPSFADHVSANDYELMYGTVHTWTRDVRDGFLDASCVAQHTPPTTATDESWRCEDSIHVAQHHISTPFFVRMDLRDSNTLPWVNPVTQASIGTAAEFAEATAASLAALSTIQSTSEEGNIVSVPPGVFAPQCTDHTGIATNRFFNQSLRRSPQENVYDNFHDMLVNWLTGASPTVLIDDPGSPMSVCSASGN